MFNINTMTTVAACEAVVTEVNRTKSLLNARVIALENQISNPELVSGLETTLQTAQSDLAACEQGLLTIGQGPYRNEQELTRHDLARRVASLQQRITNQGSHLLFYKQLALGELQLRITAMNEGLAAVEAHRLTLPPDAVGDAA